MQGSLQVAQQQQCYAERLHRISSPVYKFSCLAQVTQSVRKPLLVWRHKPSTAQCQHGLSVQGALCRLRSTCPRPSLQTAASKEPSLEVSKGERLVLGQTPLTWMKVIPLGLMFFCILFNYTCVRNTKDALVVCAPGSGAEVIPFLKALNLPTAVAFTVAYTQLANRLSSQGLFYACLLPFVAFFATFALIMYPNRDFLHPTALCDSLQQTLGERWAAPLALMRSWTYSVFYLVSEMWGAVVVSLCFWGFANQLMTVDEAKAFYPLFGMGANVSLIVAGQVTKHLSELSWGVALQALLGLVVANGLIVAGLFWGMNKWVVPKVEAQKGANATAENGGKAAKHSKGKSKNKAKMSMGESFRFLASSPYIRDMATMVVSFGVAMNLVEVTWKAKLKALYPSPGDYSAFMGQFSEGVGMLTLGMMLLGRYVLRKFGWRTAALVTPSVLAATAVAFFALVLSDGPMTSPLAAMGTTPLAAAVLVGAVQNAFSRSAKYSLFDPCKEMAYIPLDDEVKSKGKAAVDVVGNLLAKAGGSMVQQAAILACGSLATSTPLLGVMLGLVMAAWMRACFSLDTQIKALTAQQLAEAAAAEQLASVDISLEPTSATSTSQQGLERQQEAISSANASADAAQGGGTGTGTASAAVTVHGVGNIVPRPIAIKPSTKFPPPNAGSSDILPV